MYKYIVIVCYFFMLPMTTLSQEQGTLDIVVSGAKPNHGQAILSLFSSSDNYLNKPVVSVFEKIDGSGEVVFRLSDVSNGFYAISVFYDEDENGELNTSFFGIPTELVGFSNNAKGSFGPPSYDQVKFKFIDSGLILIKFVAADE